MMGRTATVAGAVLAGLLLAGCSGSDEPEADEAPSSSAPAPETSTSTPPAPAPTSEPPAPEPSSAAPPADPPTDDRVFPGGQPLSEYVGLDSYPWRVNILDNADELLDALQTVNPDLDEGAFSDVVSTCEDVARGLDTDRLISNAAVRFDVDEGKGGLLVGTSKRFGCPS